MAKKTNMCVIKIFTLFSHMKKKLMGSRFGVIEGIQKELQTTLQAVTYTTFRKIFQQWKTRWDRCMAAQRDYFKGDGNLGV